MNNAREYLVKKLNINEKIYNYVAKCEKDIKSYFDRIDDIAEFMRQSPDDPSVAFLCYDELKSKTGNKKTINLGSVSDPLLQAHNLFHALRCVDQDDSIKTVYAPLPDQENIGLALYNRLLKAAGYTVKKL